LNLADVLTLLPPALAIGLALLTSRVVPSLLAGAVCGLLVSTHGHLGQSLRLLLVGVGEVVFDLDHLRITAFTLAGGALVGVLAASEATKALVQFVERWADSRRRVGLVTWLAGLLVFFDDYANCLIVGKAMAPLCDRYRISRAKLAYIVDSTAAPLASLALVSTWAGYEVGLLDDALVAAGQADSAFVLFVKTLPYRFYSLFTLFFVGLVVWGSRDFGPMLKAEQVALQTQPVADSSESQVVCDSQQPERAWLAMSCIVVLVGGVLSSLLFQGWRATGAFGSVLALLSEADPYKAMLFGSLCAWSLSVLWVTGRGWLSMKSSLYSSWDGTKPVLGALGILYAAWLLGDAIHAAGTAGVLSSLLESNMPASFLPALVFLLSAATAFATGTSFGTMAIVIPLAVPLGVALDGGVGLLTTASAGAVLAGACFGDHSSPISDTTVLSSIGANVDVIEHTRTQLPYALATGTVSLLVGYVPAGFGVSPWVSLPLGAVACVAIVWGLGKPHTSATQS